MSWRARKIDGNHKAIVSALRQAGCSVLSIASIGNGAPDLLIGRNGWTWLLEVKTGNEKPNAAQVEWHARWKGGPVWVVRSPEEAIATINAKWGRP